MTPPTPLRLKRRAEFLFAAKGVRASTDRLTLQARRRPDAGHDDPPRVGLTVTKKVGNAVVRNRIKRRFRAAVAKTASAFEPMTDYVIVGRRAAADISFDVLAADLNDCLTRVGKSLQRREKAPTEHDQKRA